jgi:uncharacterized GH25 family protein
MSLRRVALAAAAVSAAGLALPQAALAHRAWLAPAATNFSSKDAWVSVDAAISNDLFYADHQPMGLNNIVAVAPDGSKLPLENATRGKYRTTFDVHLTQPGTSKLVVFNTGLQGTYVLNGQVQRLGGRRGPPTAPVAGPGAGGPAPAFTPPTAADIPAGATEVKLVETTSRNETYITTGAPSTEVFKPTNEGLELSPVTHPNDLVAGETATFKLLMDGKPASDVEVTVAPANQRFDATLPERKIKTDASGAFKVEWPRAGFYWLTATAEGGPGKAPNSTRRGAYTATLEVQKP